MAPIFYKNLNLERRREILNNFLIPWTCFFQPSFTDPALFDLPGGLAAFDDAIDDMLVEEAMEQLLQRSFDNEDVMSLAKDTGKQLYSGLPGRKDKINKLVSNGE